MTHANPNFYDAIVAGISSTQDHWATGSLSNAAIAAIADEIYNALPDQTSTNIDPESELLQSIVAGLFSCNSLIPSSSYGDIASAIGSFFQQVRVALDPAGGGGGFQGNQGNQGWQGNQGDSGSGVQGNQGNQGSSGLNGPQGNQGAVGSNGSQGNQGNQGAVGSQGNQGNQGAVGSNGSQGNQGNQGDVGSNGSQGNQGNQGDVGSQGNQGTIGSNGSQGNQGSQGTVGSQGNQGTIGSNGSQGNQGSQGTTGSNGVQGSQGDQGFQGDNGITGTQGNQGWQGAQGSTGIQGNQGSQGAGAQGNQGNQGWQGLASLTVTDPTISRSPIILLLGNGALTDSSGNGYNVTVAAGAVQYTSFLPGISQQGFYQDTVTRIYRNVRTTALDLVGDMTIEFLLYLHTFSSSGTERLVVYSAATDGTANTNTLYGINLTQPAIGTGVLPVFEFYSESGNNVSSFDVKGTKRLLLTRIMHIATVRSGTNFLYYINGALQETFTSITLPTKGASPVQILNLNSSRTGGSIGTDYYTIGKLQIIGSALTSDQILADAKAQLSWL